MFNYITTPTAANCIFWDDVAMVSGNEIYSLEAEISLTYSDVEGGCALDAGCTDDTTGDIDEDPLFVNTDTDVGEIDLHLRAGSPCIDTGSNGALPADWYDLDGDGDTAEPLPWDLDGNPRVAGSSVDMGAYEYQP